MVAGTVSGSGGARLLPRCWDRVLGTPGGRRSGSLAPAQAFLPCAVKHVPPLFTRSTSGTAASPHSADARLRPRAAQARVDITLVPVQLASYLLVLEPVADRSAVGAGGRVATR